jgi:hypothetical protein
MRYREHRGGLEDSMRTEIFLKDRQALIGHLQNKLFRFRDVQDEDVEVTFYAIDKRTDWKETWIVTVKDYGVIGWTDGDC